MNRWILTRQDDVFSISNDCTVRPLIVEASSTGQTQPRLVSDKLTETIVKWIGEGVWTD